MRPMDSDAAAPVAAADVPTSVPATAVDGSLQSASARYVGIDLGISCVVASSPAEDRYAVTVNTNDVSGRSTPATVSFDGKQRHVGVAADGRAMSAPRQTLSCLPMTLGTVETTRQRCQRYQLMFGVEDDGKLGPVIFNEEEFFVSPQGPLSVLLRTLASYAGSKGEVPSGELCVAVHDYFSDGEVAAVKDALTLAGLGSASVLRHSDALAAAYVHNTGASLFSEGASERVVAFVDIGVSHGTVSVVKFSAAEGADGETSSPSAEFLFRRSDESIGVRSFVEAISGEAKSRIQQKHGCTVNMHSKAGQRLSNEAMHVLKHLSMLPDADMTLEAFTPEGPDGPEIDVSLPFTKDAFESCAAASLQRLREILLEAVAAAPDGMVESMEMVGGGARVPAVQALMREAAGSAPLRSGLDGASCVASGAAAWVAGRKCVPCVAVEASGLGEDALAALRVREEGIERVHAVELERLEKRNALEGYIYKVRGELGSKDGALLNPDVLGPYLDQLQLWFEDAEYAEEPTSLETYSAKMAEAEAFVQEKGAAFFEKKAKDKEEQEKALLEETEKERKRREELGMDFDKDERLMKKEDRLRLAAKNKDEGNDMFKAQKFDDAIRRYKKAVDHVSRPEVVSNMSPDEVEEAKKIKVSCHLNSAQCYIKAADTAMNAGGKNAAEPFYKKARTSCDDVLQLDDANVKAMFRRSLCWEKLGELEPAMKDIKKALDVDPENSDCKKSQDRLNKLLQRQKEGQKKVYSKMFG